MSENNRRRRSVAPQQNVGTKSIYDSAQDFNSYKNSDYYRQLPQENKVEEYQNSVKQTFLKRNKKVNKAPKRIVIDNPANMQNNVQYNQQANPMFNQNNFSQNEAAQNFTLNSSQYYTGFINGQPIRKPIEQKATLPKWLKVGVLLLLCLNIIAFGLGIAMNTYIISSKTAKKNEHQRVINNNPLYFKSDIVKTAKRYNLHRAFVSAIIKCESSFKPEAQSNVGALGLMQLMPDTAEWISEKLNDSLYVFERMADPKTNIEYGCWYLNFLGKKFNADPILVSAAYHAGQGTVANWLADKKISQDGVSVKIENLPEGPTKQYVRRVTDAYAIYNALYYAPNAELANEGN